MFDRPLRTPPWQLPPPPVHSASGALASVRRRASGRGCRCRCVDDERERGGVDLYHQTLAAGTAGPPPARGPPAARRPTPHTFTVSTRAQLVKALGSASIPPASSRSEGTIDANTDDSGRKLTCADYASGTGYSLPAYLKAYDPATYGRSKLPSGTQEKARAAAQDRQAKNIVFKVAGQHQHRGRARHRRRDHRRHAPDPERGQRHRPQPDLLRHRGLLPAVGPDRRRRRQLELRLRLGQPARSDPRPGRTTTVHRRARTSTRRTRRTSAASTRSTTAPSASPRAPTW